MASSRNDLQYENTSKWRCPVNHSLLEELSMLRILAVLTDLLLGKRPADHVGMSWDLGGQRYWEIIGGGLAPQDKQHRDLRLLLKIIEAPFSEILAI